MVAEAEVVTKEHTIAVPWKTHAGIPKAGWDAHVLIPFGKIGADSKCSWLRFPID